MLPLVETMHVSELPKYAFMLDICVEVSVSVVMEQQQGRFYNLF